MRFIVRGLASGVFAAILVVLCAVPAWADHDRPNVILILAEDLGFGDLPRTGTSHAGTPNIEQLMRGGIIYTQFYLNATASSPSRVAFMTGQFPGKFGIHKDFGNSAKGVSFLDPAIMTLTQALKNKGYTTAHFGKWHLGHARGAPRAPTPAAYGIDVHKTTLSTGLPLPDERSPHFMALSSHIIANEAIAFVEANRTRPFYMNLWMLLPDAPLDHTEPQLKQYAKMSPSVLRDYYVSISEMDDAIGLLLDRLYGLFLARRTIIMVASATGPVHPGLSGPFRGGKTSLYEGGVRVPFVIHWRGHIPRNLVDNDSVISAVDLFPTICSWAGVDLSQQRSLDGEDVSDMFLSGAVRARTKPLMWQWRFRTKGHVLDRSPILAIRDGPWKLLMNTDGSRQELFSIPVDPTELNNVARRLPQMADRLAHDVLAWSQTLPDGPIHARAGTNDYPWPAPKR